MMLFDVTQEQRVIDWNKRHNGLKYDLSLEVRMLQEEAKEFFMAETLPERVQEYCDFLFVWCGTRVKYLANADPVTVVSKRSRINDFALVREWVDDVLRETGGNIRLQLREYYGPQAHTILKESMDAVITANEAKIPGNQTEDGKTKKGPFYESPLPVIERILENYMEKERD